MFSFNKTKIFINPIFRDYITKITNQYVERIMNNKITQKQFLITNNLNEDDNPDKNNLPGLYTFCGIIFLSLSTGLYYFIRKNK